MTIIFRNSKHVIYVKDSIRWYLGKSVQIENTWVRATQNCIGIVRHGDSSEDIDAELSNIEDTGEGSIDQKLRLRNFDARHGRIETGAVVKNRKGMSGVAGEKGTCYLWKEKGQCSKGYQCSFQHERNNRAQKPEHNAATPSEPFLSRGRSVSRKRSIRGKSNHGAILRQPCRYRSPRNCG